jgi:hypothetical protein
MLKTAIIIGLIFTAYASKTDQVTIAVAASLSPFEAFRRATIRAAMIRKTRQ